MVCRDAKPGTVFTGVEPGEKEVTKERMGMKKVMFLDSIAALPLSLCYITP